MCAVFWFLSAYFSLLFLFFFFFFNDTATTEIYTLSLHDALPSWPGTLPVMAQAHAGTVIGGVIDARVPYRSEEHTSELQSLTNLVCRLLLEKKKKKQHNYPDYKTKNKNNKTKI